MGRIAGPPFSNLCVSPLGVVPKKKVGKFRLIHHLSHPKGDSVNDEISKEEASVSYVSFDRAVDLVRVAGPGALLVKSDILSAFRLLPMHPDCFHLLGCMVDGLYYYNMFLPIGVPSHATTLNCLVHFWSGRCIMRWVPPLLSITLMIFCLSVQVFVDYFLTLFACQVMLMGCVFSHRLSLSTSSARAPGHRIHITRQLRANLGVWRTFKMV